MRVCLFATTDQCPISFPLELKMLAAAGCLIQQKFPSRKSKLGSVLKKYAEVRRRTRFVRRIIITVIITVVYFILITVVLTPMGFYEDRDLQRESSGVSIIDPSQCKSVSNLLKLGNLENSMASKKKFVVCLKEIFLPFEDNSLILAEWLEFMKIFGADKVVAFSTGDLQHSNVTEVMKYEYAVLLDMDELILPKDPTVKTWSELLETPQLKHVKNASTICFPEQQMIATEHPIQSYTTWKQKRLLKNIPRHHFFLRHVFKVSPESSSLVQFRKKCFHNLEKIVSIVAHSANSCLKDCEIHVTSADVGQSFHYRSKCSNSSQIGLDFGILNINCSDRKYPLLRMDRTILKYEKEITDNLLLALSSMKLAFK
ncbi:unnamed protein product [Notodromas monacha]|uniref:Glycosyltransferase family 92 protein n=1 Tax=Notodromas monacha TaxID=399045 RepID=A0A7R9BW71_9CRUS|nr:unnamed protein product [Notodromas monacha]CAG0921358.1 unnamed protein product [Notodromas monacha]